MRCSDELSTGSSRAGPEGLEDVFVDFQPRATHQINAVGDSRKHGVEALPESLLSMFGEPSHVLDMVLTQDKRIGGGDL